MNDRRVLIFDGECALCSRSANFVASHDGGGRLWFAHLSSEIGRTLLEEKGLDAAKVDALVLVEGDAFSTGSTAALRTVGLLGFPWSWLRALLLIPGSVREPAYRFVARNRHKLSGRASCPVPDDRLRSRLLE